MYIKPLVQSFINIIFQFLPVVLKATILSISSFKLIAILMELFRPNADCFELFCIF